MRASGGISATRALVALALTLFVGPAATASPPDAHALAKTVAGAKPSAARGAANLNGFDPRTQRLDGERLVSDLPSGQTAVLSLDAGLQAHLEKTLRQNNVPRAGVVAIDPKTGALLAYVSRDTGEFGNVDVVRDASAPTASVFKLVTSTALIDDGVGPQREACYHDGLHGLTKADIEDSPRDHRCDSLSSGVARSLNAVFAKLALKNLDRAALERHAEAFGFGQSLPFDVPVSKSVLQIPDPAVDPLEFGRASAGFFHSTMSPLQGAVLAATLANGGRMARPFIVDSVRAADGTVLSRATPSVLRQAVSERTARTVGKMMEGTVTSGTARSAFQDQRGWPYLPEIAVAGKTGTLSEEKPYRGYTWWVGFAPADKPQIAVAALIVNTPLWRIKASEVAREALRYYLVEKPKRTNAPTVAPRP